MALAFDAASSGSNATGIATWSHTCTGSNLVLVVGVSWDDTGSATISTVKYNNVSLTRKGGTKNSGSTAVDQWFLIAPATGAHNVVVTASASVYVAGGAVSFTGADQTTPLGTQATSSTTASVVVSSATGEIVVDVGCALNATTPVVGAGQTSRWNVQNTPVDAYGSTEAGAASVTMSWTVDAGVVPCCAGVGVKPVSSTTWNEALTLTTTPGFTPSTDVTFEVSQTFTTTPGFTPATDVAFAVSQTFTTTPGFEAFGGFDWDEALTLALTLGFEASADFDWNEILTLTATPGFTADTDVAFEISQTFTTTPDFAASAGLEWSEALTLALTLGFAAALSDLAFGVTLNLGAVVGFTATEQFCMGTTWTEEDIHSIIASSEWGGFEWGAGLLAEDTWDLADNESFSTTWTEEDASTTTTWTEEDPGSCS